MWTVLIITSVFLLLIIALLIPLKVNFSYQLEQTLSFKLRLAWLFVSIQKEYPSKKKKIKAKKPPKAKKVRFKRLAFKPFLSLIKDHKLRQHLFHYFKRVIRSLRFHSGKFYLHLGLDDPADTGWVSGMIIPVFLHMQRQHVLDMRYDPDFSQPILESEGQSVFEIHLLTLLISTFFFTLSPHTFKLVLNMRKGFQT